MFELFLGGLVQTIVLVFNIRNIVQKRYVWSFVTAFFMAIVWALVVQEIARNLNSFEHVIAYAVGASIGTVVGIYGSVTTVQFFQHRKEVVYESKKDR
ncbi:MAG: DUF5698 domain-containing protein [Patescibacteria group bacterium]